MKKLSKSYQILVMFSTITLVFIAMNTASAAVLDVGPSGHTYTDINSAVAASAFGDDIMVYDNNGVAYTYPEVGGLYVDENVNIQANGDVTISTTSSSAPVVDISAAGSGTTLQGFKITGPTSNCAIQIDTMAVNCKILDNEIFNCGRGIYNMGSNNEIAGNTITLAGSGSGSVIGVEVADYSNPGGNTNNQIYDNKITITQSLLGNAEGISLGRTSNADIYRNTISVVNSGAGGYSNGIRLADTGSNFELYENKITVQGGVATGIWLGIMSNIQVYSNSIESSRLGLYVNAPAPIINFNRIIADVQYLAWYGQGTLNAENNWFGTNTPDASKFVGNLAWIDYNPWLKMTLFQSATTLNLGETANILADFTINSNNENTLALYGKHLIDGILVKFTTNLGNIGSKEAFYNTLNGVATALFRADEAAGSSTITELLDGVLLSTTINIRGSSTSVNAASSTSTNTVGMQNTGTPIATIVLAALLIFAGIVIPKKK